MLTNILMSCTIETNTKRLQSEAYMPPNEK